jgi:hypothetical protein
MAFRERESELVTLELGPVTAIEQRRKLAAEIDQDRFTCIDPTRFTHLFGVSSHEAWP